MLKKKISSKKKLIGLYKAIRDFNEDKLTSLKGLRSYVSQDKSLRQLKRLLRQKHGLVKFVHFIGQASVYDEESNYTLMDMIPGDQIVNLEAVLIHQEKVEDRELKIAGNT